MVEYDPNNELSDEELDKLKDLLDRFLNWNWLVLIVWLGIFNIGFLIWYGILQFIKSLIW